MPVPHNKHSRGVQPRVTAKHGNGRRQHMAFPRHPIIDVTPIDAARGAAQTAGATAHTAAEAFTPPTFGKQKQAVDNEPLHTTFVDGFGNPVREKAAVV